MGGGGGKHWMDSKKPLIESCWCYTRGERETENTLIGRENGKLDPVCAHIKAWTHWLFVFWQVLGAGKSRKYIHIPPSFSPGSVAAHLLSRSHFLWCCWCFQRAFCLKGVLNHLTRVSSICLLTSKNTHTHTHIFFIETSKPKGGDHRTCWPTNSRWDPYDGDDVAVRHFHFDHYAACVCVCLSEHPYVSLCFMHTAIIKAATDPLLGKFSVSYRLDPEAC